MLLSCFGGALTKPFLIVFLHEVRGIGLGTAGLLLAERDDDAIDAITRIGEHLLDIPLPEPVQQVVTDSPRHEPPFPLVR